MPNESGAIDCTTAVQQLWDFLDEELTVERMAAVQAHLEQCAACLPHAQFAERFLAALQSTRESRPCPASVRRKVIESLAAAGLQAS